MTMAIDPFSNELNYVVVAGIQSPGRAQFSNVSQPFIYDVQPSYGMSGATMIFRGRGIARPKLTIMLWLREHFIAWPIFKKVLEPPKTAKPLVVEMRHPILSSADIKAVAVENLGEPERQPNGGWLARIDLIEWRPPQQAIVKPRGAIPSPTKGAPLTPKTEADIALVEVRAQVAANRLAASRAGSQ